MDLVSNCILFHHNIVRCFHKIMQELSRMLYGYGDDRNPYTETVEFLEDVAVQFIILLTGPAGMLYLGRVVSSSGPLIFVTHRLGVSRTW